MNKSPVWKKLINSIKYLSLMARKVKSRFPIFRVGVFCGSPMNQFSLILMDQSHEKLVFDGGLRTFKCCYSQQILEVGLPMSKFQVDPTKKWTSDLDSPSEIRLN